MSLEYTICELRILCAHKYLSRDTNLREWGSLLVLFGQNLNNNGEKIAI